MFYTKVDLGASETRYKGENTPVMILPNDTYFVEMDYENDLQLDNKDDFINGLDVRIVKDGPSDYFPTRALIGTMATRTTPNPVKPAGNKLKSNQKVNYVSVITATAHTMMNVQGASIPEVVLMLAFPPMELTIRGQKQYIKEQFMGTYTVTFEKLDKTVAFKVVDVVPSQESFLAMMAFNVDKTGRKTEFYNEYSSGDVMSIDIGASTTDIVVFQNGKYVEHSAHTVASGGNVAIQFFIEEFRRGEQGYKITKEQAKEAFCTGRTRDGNTWKDVSKYVDRAKRRFSDKVISDLRDYFEAKNLTEQAIRAICISGGGSMESSYVENGVVIKTTEPMSYYITEYIKESSPNLVVKQYDGNSRHANVDGLDVLAKFHSARMKAQAQRQ